jgi:hypothetical protein
MSGPEPLSREERDILLSHLVYPSRDPATVEWDGESVPDEMQLHELWEATVQSVEAERDALREALSEIAWRVCETATRRPEWGELHTIAMRALWPSPERGEEPTDA